MTSTAPGWRNSAACALWRFIEMAVMKKKSVFVRRWAELLRIFANKVFGRHHYSCVNGARCWSEGAKNNYPKIRIDESRTIHSEGIQSELKEKGGVIVFPADAGAVELSPEKIRKGLISASVFDKDGAAGWMIGHYLDGRYIAGNGAAFRETSLSAAVAGIDFNSLLWLAEEFCRDFGQKNVLVHDFADRRILVVNAD